MLTSFPMTNHNIFHDPTGKEYVKPDGVEAAWRPSVYGLARNEAGDVLMVKPGWNDQWELPGGGLDLGENVLDALKREFFEETGYRCEVATEAPIHVLQDRMYLRQKEVFVHTLCLYYLVKLTHELRDTSAMNVEFPDEVVDMQWVPIQDCNEKTCHFVAWSLLRTLK